MLMEGREKNNYKKIIDTMPEGIIFIKDERVRLANRMANKLLINNF